MIGLRLSKVEIASLDSWGQDARLHALGGDPKTNPQPQVFSGKNNSGGSVSIVPSRTAVKIIYPLCRGLGLGLSGLARFSLFLQSVVRWEGLQARALGRADRKDSPQTSQMQVYCLSFLRGLRSTDLP